VALLDNKGEFQMRTSSIILTAIMAGIYSGVLDGFEENWGLSPIASVLILIVMTLCTGLIFNNILLKRVN
jgi:hypothetical protein